MPFLMNPPRETVVLVHGLWMHGSVFLVLKRRLARLGFHVRAFSYPSVRRHLGHNARALARFVAATPGERVHLVGHSLGGLVVLAMLAQHPDPRVERAVLLGAPCAGSHSASVLLRARGLGWLVGCSIRDWLAQPRPPLPEAVELGAIAGTLSLGMGRVIPGLPRPNDGVITVEEARLPEARDFIELHVSHSGMLVSRACAEQVAAFLMAGRFVHA
jgi:pimeloyl-ACP methyl ester carboxylesterase